MGKGLGNHRTLDRSPDSLGILSTPRPQHPPCVGCPPNVVDTAEVEVNSLSKSLSFASPRQVKFGQLLVRSATATFYLKVPAIRLPGAHTFVDLQSYLTPLPQHYPSSDLDIRNILSNPRPIVTHHDRFSNYCGKAYSERTRLPDAFRRVWWIYFQGIPTLVPWLIAPDAPCFLLNPLPGILFAFC